MIEPPENSIEPFIGWFPSYRWPTVPEGVMWLPDMRYPRVWSEGATDEEISQWIAANKPEKES